MNSEEPTDSFLFDCSLDLRLFEDHLRSKYPGLVHASFKHIEGHRYEISAPIKDLVAAHVPTGGFRAYVVKLAAEHGVAVKPAVNPANDF